MLKPAILREVRCYLSFRDLCLTRQVCKEWYDISGTPCGSTIYFFADGSNVNFPDSTDPSYRKCLLNARVEKIHCEIWHQEEVDFLLQILPCVKWLTMEIYGPDGAGADSLGFSKWDSECLLAAKHLRSLDLSGCDFDHTVTIDFAELPFLTSLEVDVPMKVRNYDFREMGCFANCIDIWDELTSQIASRTRTLKVQRNQDVSADFRRFLKGWITSWVSQKRQLPIRMEGRKYSMHFCTLTREGLFVMPIFLIRGSQNQTFQLEYHRVFTRFYTDFPNVPIQFHKDCDNRNRSLWLKILNPIRAGFGLKPFRLENVIQQTS